MTQLRKVRCGKGYVDLDLTRPSATPTFRALQGPPLALSRAFDTPQESITLPSDTIRVHLKLGRAQ